MLVVASLGLGMRIVTELTVLELSGSGIKGKQLTSRGVATTVALVILDRVELDR